MPHLDIPQYGPDPQSQFWNRTIGGSSPNITRTTDGFFLMFSGAKHAWVNARRGVYGHRAQRKLPDASEIR